MRQNSAPCGGRTERLCDTNLKYDTLSEWLLLATHQGSVREKLMRLVNMYLYLVQSFVQLESAAYQPQMLICRGLELY